MSSFSSFSFESILGKTINTKDGEAPTSSTLDGKTVMLYFSAHWCPPCKRFTPVLSKFYTNLKAKNSDFECVFVSSDKDEETFKEYSDSMSFLSLPFKEREIKAKLSKTYKIQGIPSLVVIGSDGELITANGRSKVEEDPTGKNFPWAPKTFSEIMPSKLTSKDGDEAVETSTLDDKILMVYFSAHWCPPCRGYTPELVKVYNELKAQKKDVELVFASSDKDTASFEEYYGEMPWLAVPFKERDAAADLGELFNCEGIPLLVVLDKKGSDGKRAVINGSSRPTLNDVADFPWYPKPFANISKTVECNGSNINEEPALIILCEGADDEEQDEIKELIAKISAEKKDECLFFYADSSAGPVPQLRKFCGLKNDGATVMLKMDIPDDGAYYLAKGKGEITEDSIRAFLKDSGERKQMQM